MTSVNYFAHYNVLLNIRQDIIRYVFYYYAQRYVGRYIFCFQFSSRKQLQGNVKIPITILHTRITYKT